MNSSSYYCYYYYYYYYIITENLSYLYEGHNNLEYIDGDLGNMSMIVESQIEDCYWSHFEEELRSMIVDMEDYFKGDGFF